MENTLNVDLLMYSQSLTSEKIKVLENSNKVILPSKILETSFKIDNDVNTKYYILTNIKEFGLFTKIVAVYEYTAPDNKIYLPTKLAEDLFVTKDDTIIINECSLDKGEYIKVKPLCKKFYDKINIKELFEETINKNYPMLSIGDIITITDSDDDIKIEITECLPNNTISTVDTNLNVDFEKPDFDITKDKISTNDKISTEDIINNLNTYCENLVDKEDMPQENYKSNDEYEYIEPIPGKFVPFSGKGHKLGSK